MSDELADLCLSYLKPPKHSGGSWTLNPTALAEAIRSRWVLIDPDDVTVKVVSELSLSTVAYLRDAR